MKTKNQFIIFNDLSHLALLILVVFLVSCRGKTDQKTGSQQGGAYPETGDVERLDPMMDEIIAPGILPERLADSFMWSEGPLWLPEQDMVIFSDIPRNAIYQWSESGGLKLYLKPSGYTGTIPREEESGSNGLLLDPRGRLVLCQHGDRRMALMKATLHDPAPEFETIAGTWRGKRFNSPNDAVFSSKGELYFTDPAYGMEEGWEDPKREIDFTGVFRWTPGEEVALLIDSLSAPNGIGLSPDEKTLYVADSRKTLIYAYQINADRSLSNGRIFFDASVLRSEDRRGGADGMVVRNDGIIFATGPGGVLVLSPRGKHLGSILTGQRTANCTLDESNDYLYMTAHMFLMRIKLR